MLHHTLLQTLTHSLILLSQHLNTINQIHFLIIILLVTSFKKFISLFQFVNFGL